MSRIGKKLIEIPQGVTVEISEKEIKVKGPKGELTQVIHPEIKIEQKDGKVFVAPKAELSKKGRGLWGLYRALVANMVEGVSKGFEKKLEIEGVGFKAAVDAEGITLNLGFTNPVKIAKIDGVDFKVEKNVITVSGANRRKLNHIKERELNIREKRSEEKKVKK